MARGHPGCAFVVGVGGNAQSQKARALGEVRQVRGSPQHDQLRTRRELVTGHCEEAPTTGEDQVLVLPPGDLSGDATQPEPRRSPAAVRADAGRRATIERLIARSPGTTTFITAGRLSPEKNHERLVRAFEIVHRETPATRLVIMGEGPLRPDLERLVDSLGLESVVTLAGHVPNPYYAMARSDCFVLSSNYEGLPMVLLEAMALGLAVVSTNFASVRDAVGRAQGWWSARA
jgi:CDP-glycerol glycerophosphotransferase